MRVFHQCSCPGCGRVSLHDIEDAKAFVMATILKGKLLLSGEEREELLSEGVRILIALARDYQPGRGGLDAAGSRFSGYAAKYLPGKLSDAWHRLQGHRLQSTEDGPRKWEIALQPASLDVIASEMPYGVDTITALQHEDRWEPEVVNELPKLLADWWEERCRLVIRYAAMREEGFRLREFAAEESLSIGQAKEIEQHAKYLVRKLRRIASPIVKAA